MKIIPFGGCIALCGVSSFAFSVSAVIADNTRAAAPLVWVKTCTVQKDPRERALITACKGWKKSEDLSINAAALMRKEASLIVHCSAFAKEWPADDLDVVCK